jgi:DNA-binding MarR family transcriptional regulator
MNSPTLPFGTAMALAERNLRGPLSRILTEQHLEPGAWFTLNALGLRGEVAASALKGMLSTNGYDPPSADNLIGGLSSDGLIQQSGKQLQLTPAGSERYAAVRDQIATVTARIFSLYDATKVETARTVLQQIAETDPTTIEAVAFDQAPA